MPNIIIDEKIRDMLPALDEAVYAALEENILQNGCRDPLVLWGDILIDGHNRYKICTEHDIPYNTVSKEFGSREEALIWIIATQVARRNLTPTQLSYYRGMHYIAEKKIIKNENGLNQHSEEVLYHNDIKPKIPFTADRLSTIYGVSTATINRDAKLAESLEAIGETSPEAKRMILAGKCKIDKKELQRLVNDDNGELSETARAIENGTYEKKKIVKDIIDGPAGLSGGLYGSRDDAGAGQPGMQNTPGAGQFNKW